MSLFKPLQYLKVLKDAAIEFVSDNAIKLCAALAYYTIFAVGPFLLVIISFAGIFIEKQAVTYKVYNEMVTFLGPSAAQQLLGIIANMQKQNVAAKYTLIGGIVLLVGASGLFAEIQDSINFIFSIRPKPKRSWLEYIKNRVLSFSLIIGIGFLLMVSLLVNTFVDIITGRLLMHFTSIAVIVFKVFNIALLYIIISCLFAIVYKILPDAVIKWKDAFIGASFTGILFIIGKSLIGYYLGNSGLGVIYGTAASFIIILSWVYYTAVILYFGAEFTKVYALKLGGGIEPYKTAVFIIKREAKELEKGSADLV